jgi:hypothetical protein
VGTTKRGITFTATDDHTPSAYNNFPVDDLLTHADANWGPQDASQPNTAIPKQPQELLPFQTRSMSGFVIFMSSGPLHWSSRRQCITAQSSAEAEIYATNTAANTLQEISHIFDDLDLFLSPDKPLSIFNDNRACVDWYKTTTTKGLRHIQMRENRVRELIADHFDVVQHIPGKDNIADILRKK